MTLLDGRVARIAPSPLHGPAYGRPERELHARLERLREALPDHGGGPAPAVPRARGAAVLAEELSAHCLERLRTGDPGDRDAATHRDALVALRAMATEAFAFDRARTAQRVTGCRIALDVLRAAPTPHHLVEELCAELVRHVGFRRATLARRDDGDWEPWTAAVTDDCPGDDAPRELLAAPPQRAIARVVRAGDEELGLLVVDHGPDGRDVDALDREAFDLFAAGVGATFERTAMLARLRLQRDHVLERLAAVDRDVGELTSAPVELTHLPEAGSATVAPRVAPALRNALGESDDDDRLTVRQAEILGLVLHGHSNASVAAELGITVGTAKSHVKRILRKLGVINRAQAISACIDAGWEPPRREPPVASSGSDDR
ncbi:helix-turn-helix transcriptional regulator [Patulibacter minatonensis]|uniref:helix-turn-helix transcriptional regulator n=1 Tax=Patulibacter minatonensis TaxID=298163 RepID=UPI00047ABF58|nr:helix-turn-helix transcriptional regulator [Patulibacter minatonensis]